MIANNEQIKQLATVHVYTHLFSSTNQVAGGRKVVVRTDVFSRYVGAVEARSGFICLKVDNVIKHYSGAKLNFFSE